MPDAPTPIQEAVAHLRDDADFNRSWTDGRRRHSQSASADYIARRLEVAAQRDLWADAIEAQGREIERLRNAGWQPIETAPKGTQLLFWWIPKTPNRHAEKCVFAHISSYEDGVWWNGQIGAYQSIKHLTHWMPLPEPPNPTDAHPTADRDTALNTTPLPASAPPLGAPAPFPKGGFATNKEDAEWMAERLLCRINQTLQVGGLSANFTVRRLDEFILLALDAASERATKPMRAALKAARELIARDRNEIAEVAELTEFFGGGEWRKDRNVAEYNAVLAQIDEVMK